MLLDASHQNTYTYIFFFGKIAMKHSNNKDHYENECTVFSHQRGSYSENLLHTFQNRCYNVC